MSIDFDFDDLRPKYRLCRAGFGLMGFSLALLCFDATCWLAFFFTRNPKLWELLHSSWWPWAVGAPITWASLLGSYLLWGRWTEAVWQKRVGLLVLMNAFDVLTWAIDRSGDLGLRIDTERHRYLFFEISAGLGWAELMLTAGLAADLAAHLGKDDAPETGKAAQSFASIGLVFWTLGFAFQTDWFSWPLRARPMRAPEFLLSFLGTRLLLVITAFQVTALCGLAVKRCALYLAELNHREEHHELLAPRSDDELWK